MNSQLWTVERVKNELPTVTVDYNGQLMSATVSGRHNQFATVTVYHPSSTGYTQYEFAWSTIAHSLNNKTALHI